MRSHSESQISRPREGVSAQRVSRPGGPGALPPEIRGLCTRTLCWFSSEAVREVGLPLTAAHPRVCLGQVRKRTGEQMPSTVRRQ